MLYIGNIARLKRKKVSLLLTNQSWQPNIEIGKENEPENEPVEPGRGIPRGGPAVVGEGGLASVANVGTGTTGGGKGATGGTGKKGGKGATGGGKAGGVGLTGGKKTKGGIRRRLAAACAGATGGGGTISIKSKGRRLDARGRKRLEEPLGGGPPNLYINLEVLAMTAPGSLFFLGYFEEDIKGDEDITFRVLEDLNVAITHLGFSIIRESKENRWASAEECNNHRVPQQQLLRAIDILISDIGTTESEGRLSDDHRRAGMDLIHRAQGLADTIYEPMRRFIQGEHVRKYNKALNFSAEQYIADYNITDVEVQNDIRSIQEAYVGAMDEITNSKFAYSSILIWEYLLKKPINAVVDEYIRGRREDDVHVVGTPRFELPRQIIHDVQPTIDCVDKECRVTYIGLITLINRLARIRKDISLMSDAHVFSVGRETDLHAILDTYQGALDKLYKTVKETPGARNNLKATFEILTDYDDGAEFLGDLYEGVYAPVDEGARLLLEKRKQDVKNIQEAYLKVRTDGKISDHLVGRIEECVYTINMFIERGLLNGASTTRGEDFIHDVEEQFKAICNMCRNNHITLPKEVEYNVDNVGSAHSSPYSAGATGRGLAPSERDGDGNGKYEL